MSDIDCMLQLTEELCEYPTGVVSDGNAALFERIGRELPITLHRFKSGDQFNGWSVPQNWRVHHATIRRNGVTVFDGTEHTLGVARYSKSFQGTLDWDQLQPYLVTNPNLPDAYLFHCMWQYRPWQADWALCVPYQIHQQLGPGQYEVDLRTEYSPGEMLVAEYELKGQSDKTIVLNAHTCHPHMANDGFAGVAMLIRLVQWLRDQNPFYTYRVVFGPEHLGTVFYLRDLPRHRIDCCVAGVFAEMPGTTGPIKLASTFLGNQPIDRALAHACRHHSRAWVDVPWRCGAGNDETVWEAPGYEVPFVEMTRCIDQFDPFREYHTSLDTTDSLLANQVDEFYQSLKQAVLILEQNARLHRKFDGLICLSNPQYDLYLERPDPAVNKGLEEDSERWGHLLDSLFRYFDGSTTVLDIAEKHQLPFDRLVAYLKRFEAKSLVEFERVQIERTLPHRLAETSRAA